MKYVLVLLCFATMAIMVSAEPSPRRVLNLPQAKDNPRNGEGDFIRLKDGRILFVYTEYRGESNLDHAPAHLVKCYSSDGGETWTKPVETVPRSGKQNDMCVSLIRLKDGRIGLMYLRKNSATDCRPVMRFSSDEGETWSGITECVAASETAYWVGNNARLTMLKSGRLIEPLARHNPSDGQFGRLMCVYSDDQGTTWKSGNLYEPPKDEAGKPVIVQEPGVVELKDGRLYLYARTDRGRQWQAFSKDGGVTWEYFGPSPIYGPRGPATISRLKSGDLLLVWNDHEGHPEYMKRGEPWLVGIRAPLTLAISKDEGRTWINRKTLETDLDGFFCYFAVLEQDDGLLLAYYNQPNLAGCCVTKVPFDWLQASEGAGERK
ncbi:MAG: glycoside hydrolase [Kiritimatiellae bacterium]|nr:glycoside hydrolase [Kiritimatiellia bacterium]